MRFFWLRDRERQGQFLVYWKPGKKNKSDYFSKHHPVAHHRNVRPNYIYDPANPKPYYDPSANYYASLSDDDDTEPETDVDSDSETVETSNRSRRVRFMDTGEGVLSDRSVRQSVRPSS